LQAKSDGDIHKDSWSFHYWHQKARWTEAMSSTWF
jgi:hypothetical protein